MQTTTESVLYSELTARNPVAFPANPTRAGDTFQFSTPTNTPGGPLKGFETFSTGELIAIDGDEEIRAPCDACTVLMPTREPVVGREGVYLSRPML